MVFSNNFPFALVLNLSPPLLACRTNGQGSFWRKAEQCDIFILLDTVEFSDGPDAYQNFQLLPNGKKLTVPIKHPRLHKLIKDVEIDWAQYRYRSQIQLIRQDITLEPYAIALEECADGIYKAHALHSRPYLANLNRCIILTLAEETFKLKCKFMRSSELKTPLEPMRGEDQILNIILELQADTYLAGPSWREYAPNLKEVLKEHGIELEEVK